MRRPINDGPIISNVIRTGRVISAEPSRCAAPPGVGTGGRSQHTPHRMCVYLYIAALRRIAMGTDHFSATIAAKRGGLSAERRSAENLSVAASPLVSDVACFE